MERRMSISSIINVDNRKEIIFDLFGDIGDIEEGNEKNIKIPYSKIKWYSKQMTALIFPNAIEIITEEEKFQFRSFLNRNKVFQLIDDNMNKYYDERDIAQQAEQSQEVAKLNVFQKVMDSTRAAGQTQSSGGDQSSAKAPTAAPSDKASV